MIKLYRVETVEEYVRVASEIATSSDSATWFRGQGSGEYRLLPSALRDVVPTHDARGYPLRGDEQLNSRGLKMTGISPERLLAEFKRRALPFVQAQPRNDFEWLFLMQHHGVPTRLLDWSTNALAALYFAVEHARPPELSDRPVEDEGLQEFSSDDVAVYCMNPATINSVLHAVNGPIDIAEAGERWAKYADPCASEIAAYEPVCIVAPHVSPRIRAQSGTFTLHGSNVDPLDYYDNLRGLLHKVLISKRSAERIRGQLALLGMTTSYIYPDLDGLAREITAQERERFLAQRRRHLASLTASNN